MGLFFLLNYSLNGSKLVQYKSEVDTDEITSWVQDTAVYSNNTPLSVLQDSSCAKHKKYIYCSQPHYLCTSTSVINSSSSAHLWSGESWFSCPGQGTWKHFSWCCRDLQGRTASVYSCSEAKEEYNKCGTKQPHHLKVVSEIFWVRNSTSSATPFPLIFRDPLFIIYLKHHNNEFMKKISTSSSLLTLNYEKFKVTSLIFSIKNRHHSNGACERNTVSHETIKTDS